MLVPRRAPALVSLLLIVIAAVDRPAFADDGAKKKAADLNNKLTVAYYDFSTPVTGLDVNIRHTFATSTAWLGAYHEDDGFDQVRTGYEFDWRTRWGTLVPSAQAATHGFFGATIYAEVGKPFFGIGGAGRTNLHPYWNLGFDPNDYIQFGGGYRDHAGNTYMVYAIHDNRLDTGQTNTHFYFRRHFGEDWRLTIDVVREHGDGDDGLVVRSWAPTTDVDWRRWFVRVSVDPHVNYRPDHQVRVASGVRF